MFAAGRITAAVLAVLPADLSTKTADEAAAVQWLDSSARGFTSEAPSADELTPLAASLADAQIVGVGEATHGDHEDQAFKSELIKALVQKNGVQVVILEMNHRVGVDLDAYVNGRGGDLPVLLRSPSFFRTWRTDEFAGLMIWLRAYNVEAARPVHIIGVDVQDPGADADLALRFVAARDPASATRLRKAFVGLLPGQGSQRFAPWQASVDKPTYLSAMQASIQLEQLFKANRLSWSKSADYAEAAYAAKTTRQALNVFELDNQRGDTEADGSAYWGRRDRFMAANALERLNGRTGVVWAHDMHVIADVLPSDGWPSGYTWMGRELKRSLGPRYLTVSFAWSAGSFRAQSLADDSASGLTEGMAKRLPMVPQSPPNDLPQDLGGVLGRTHADRFWVDLRQLPQQPWALRFAATSYYRGWEGWLSIRSIGTATYRIAPPCVLERMSWSGSGGSRRPTFYPVTTSSRIGVEVARSALSAKGQSPKWL